MVMPIGNDVMISSGGLVNDANGISFYVDSPVYFGGTNVKFNPSLDLDDDGNMWITQATKVDRPIGYTIKSTQNPIVPYMYVTAAHYLQDIKLTVNRYVEGHIVSMPMCAGHVKISRGDKVGVAYLGEIDKFSNISGGVFSLGIALDEAAADTGTPGAAGFNASCIRIRIQLKDEV